MQKIILESLKLAGYKNANELANVVNATPNPLAATEMLLGVFEEIQPSEFGFGWTSKWRGTDNFFILVERIDSLTNTVYFTKFTHKTKKVYYATKLDYEAKVYTDERGEQCYTSGDVRINGYTTEDNLSSTFEKFYESYKAEARVTALFDWQEEALNYGREIELFEISNEASLA